VVVHVEKRRRGRQKVPDTFFGPVLAAVTSGALGEEHYANFLKLRTESEFYRMSYAEKRKKDRDFGRFIKSVKKDLGDD
jgi:ribosome biogenesis GTPase